MHVAVADDHLVRGSYRAAAARAMLMLNQNYAPWQL